MQYCEGCARPFVGGGSASGEKDYYPSLHGAPPIGSWDELCAFPDVDDGWAYFTESDLTRILYGDGVPPDGGRPPREWVRGYYNTKRRARLEGLLGPGFDSRYSPSGVLGAYWNSRCHKYEHSVLVLENWDGDKLELLPRVRGTGLYRRDMLRRFGALADYCKEKSQEMCLLTLSAWSPPGTSPLDLEARWQGVINLLMSFLAERREYRAQYVWVKEHTKRGYTHVHIAFVNCSYVAPLDVLGDWWAKQGMGSRPGVDIKSVSPGPRQREKVFSYLAKYLGKTFEGCSEGESSSEVGSNVTKLCYNASCDARWQGMMSMLGHRVWGMSNRLRRSMQSAVLPGVDGEASDGLVDRDSLIQSAPEWHLVGLRYISPPNEGDTRKSDALRGGPGPPHVSRDDIVRARDLLGVGS